MDTVQGEASPLMADNMLGTLAKWLRVAGADCDYADGMEDDDLLQVALSGRIVLTRDKVLARRCGDSGLFVESDDLEEQLLQVFRALPELLEEEPLSRCLVCNVKVVAAARGDVEGTVHPGVLERHDEFWLCPRCGRAYWVGTHVEDMLDRLAGLKERARG
ncbi:MAG: Mut7-C RNAse domain-containing protein [Thermoplasmata archaeon]|nr:Mut7-C RNAse domain-containing protein [Thermoplasmata archaeon]